MDLVHAMRRYKSQPQTLKRKLDTIVLAAFVIVESRPERVYVCSKSQGRLLIGQPPAAGCGDRLATKHLQIESGCIGVLGCQMDTVQRTPDRCPQASYSERLP